ncbi:uncharacterized protein LOC113035366 [Astatotilapia calliptera]|uniref:uncharacterized protein LOC113035366 n=1 Tax=Astatotilapia calliptera TaxID=8154 RepID=UPI000E3FC55F|nr:uncharacterized protein LOC113035366 [Astatotilapia calliptera]
MPPSAMTVGQPKDTISAMDRTCCVVGCNVRSHDREGKKLDNGLSFHRFPSWRQREGSHVSDITKQRRQAWIAAVRRADIEFSAIPSFLLVCSRHFLSGKPAYEMDVTNPDWAPTLHMGHDDIPVSDSDRHSRRTQRKRKRAPIGGFRYAAAESEGVPRAEVIDEDLTEDQQQNHNVMEAVDSSCVGQVEVEVAAANVDILKKCKPFKMMTDYKLSALVVAAQLRKFGWAAL